MTSIHLWADNMAPDDKLFYQALDSGSRSFAKRAD